MSLSVSRSIHLALIFSLTICAFPFFSTFGVSAQSRSVPYEADLESTFYAESLNYSYPTTYEQIEDVDFKNLTVHVFDANGKPEMKVKLTKGSYESHENFGFETVTLDSVHPLPAKDSNSKYKVVFYTWFYGGGSSNKEGIAQVFELLEHRLTLKQQLDWDEHFDTSKPYSSLNEKSGTLMLRTAHSLPGDAHCCVSAMDVITMQWNGSRFVKKIMSTELSDYGVREGKKL
jgi:hypothetical protein